MKGKNRSNRNAGVPYIRSKISLEKQKKAGEAAMLVVRLADQCIISSINAQLIGHTEFATGGVVMSNGGE